MKNHSKKIVLLVILLSLVILGISMIPAQSAGENITLVIVHTNDFHGNLKPVTDKKMDENNNVGGAAYMAATINNLRREYPDKILLLDAGDTVQGTPISNIFYGKPVHKIFNYLRYDARTLGNHEFDWGQDVLVKMIEECEFPNLAANVVYKDDPTKLLPGVKPYIVKEVNGVKVGIIGITYEGTPVITSAKSTEGLLFLDPVKTLEKNIPLVRKEGAELIIALTHCGIEQDKKIAKKVKGIDIVIGGHSHTEIHDPLKIDETIIVQAGSSGRYVGKLVLQLEPDTKKILTYTTNNVLIPVLHTDLNPDPEVESIIASYDDQIKDKMARVIAKTDVDLVTSRSGKNADTVMGNIITDSLKDETGADIALYNAGGIRASIFRGDIKVEDVFKVLPFDNVVVTIELSGKDLKRVLEHGVSGKYGSVQVAGLNVVVNNSKPKGSRICRVSVNGHPLEDNKYYKVATIDYIFKGGDGFDFSGARNPVYGSESRAVFAQYLTKQKLIRKVDSGRVTRGDGCGDCLKKNDCRKEGCSGQKDAKSHEKCGK
jgi:2',3'-cyclic-nucleotide 2'-phosphodiesterase (5'-nucleotidase family)